MKIGNQNKRSLLKSGFFIHVSVFFSTHPTTHRSFVFY